MYSRRCQRGKITGIKAVYPLNQLSLVCLRIERWFEQFAPLFLDGSAILSREPSSPKRITSDRNSPNLDHPYSVQLPTRRWMRSVSGGTLPSRSGLFSIARSPYQMLCLPIAVGKTTRHCYS